MPTFLIFRSGRVIQTLRGADRGALTSAIENAVKYAKPVYSSTGHTLGGASSARASSSLRRPWSWSINSLLNAFLNFIGLYLISLFSVSRIPKHSDKKSFIQVLNSCSLTLMDPPRVRHSIFIGNGQN